MKIDFTMSGINIILLIGIVFVLQGICLLVIQNPFKKIKHFCWRDYILLGIILAFIAAGVICLIFGVLSAVNQAV